MSDISLPRISHSMKKYILFIICLSGIQIIAAQSAFTVSGNVIDSSTREPLVSASVFCQHTTQGTTTGQEGNFSITLKEGGYDLVISYTGYLSQMIRISPEIKTTDLVIEMVKEEKNIEEVIIRNTYEVADGWEKYGSFFLENFIGSTPFARHCRLLNPEVLKFYFYRRSDKLKVLAEEPLRIANHALGYMVRYQLDSFLFYNKNDICSYTGYSFYEEMNNRDSIRIWQRNREKAYYGSRLHFMHSYFDTTLTKEGFRLTVLDDNDETKFNPVDNPYNEKIFRAVDSMGEIEIWYPNRISITYIKSHPENEYLKKYQLPMDIGVQISYIDMFDVITIRQNGYYYDQRDWVNFGYWSWKNVADQVPLDFEPVRLR